MLAAAMNPCPCGYLGEPDGRVSLHLPMIQRYISKISGPLLDRIDMHVDVPAVNYKEMRDKAQAPESCCADPPARDSRARDAARSLCGE